MMPYITRDNQSNINGLFNCQQFPGQEYLEVAALYVPPLSPLAQIRALEAQYADDQSRMTRVSILDIARREGLALAIKAVTDAVNAQAVDQGLTEPQRVALLAQQLAPVTPAYVHAQLMLKSGYRSLFELEEQISALRALL